MGDPYNFAEPVYKAMLLKEQFATIYEFREKKDAQPALSRKGGGVSPRHRTFPDLALIPGFTGAGGEGFGRLSDNLSALCRILKCKSRDGPVLLAWRGFLL
jgi:hypothetical protein